MAGCNSSCYPSWPYHSLAFAQQTNLPGHAGWLLRAGHCSVEAVPVTAFSGQTTLCPRHLPHLQTMCQGLPLLLRQFLPKNTPHLPEAPTLPQPTLHTTLLPQVHTDLVLVHFHLKTKQDQKKIPFKNTHQTSHNSSSGCIISASPPPLPSLSAHKETLAPTKPQPDTSDTPAAMQALKQNPVQNCAQFPGDWKCIGLEERHPLISPGSFPHTPHGAHLTSALPYFVQQL